MFSRKLVQILLFAYCGVVMFLLSSSTALPQAITKTDPPIVNTPSTVGRIPKWWGVRNNGIGIIGDSVITESGGNIGIDVTNPTEKLTVGGGLTASGAINTSSQYNIGGQRVFIADLAKLNLFAGFTTGSSNTTGDRNAFFGINAGIFNTTGSANSFFGFFAGKSNTSGGGNSFFGLQAGFSNTTGFSNSFFGVVAGNNNTTGNNNAFFGSAAGLRHVSGSQNSFVGSNAGFNNTNGSSNSFFGFNAGSFNTFESNNTFIGAFTNGAAGISNATALGAGAIVTQSNSVVLGNSANVGIGTSAPQAKLHAVGPTAGRFDGDVNIGGNLSVSGAANLTASNAIHANAADIATNFTGPLSGDVTGTQNATVVSSVGGQSAANVAAATSAFNGATNNNVAGTLVKRDASGNFSANTVNVSQVSASTIGLAQGTITSGPTSLMLKGLTTPQGATGAYLNLGSGNFYYPGGSVTLGAGATAPDYNSAPGPYITMTGTHFDSGGDITIASGHPYSTGGDTGGIITLNASGAWGGHHPPPGYLSFQIAGIETLRVANNLNVGIGTTTPQGKLHVSNVGGAVGQFDGNVTVNGNLTVTGSSNLATTVNHDATLTGNGTASSPLSVLSAPNGVVTTGSYANPAWITSLDGNKITAGTAVKSINGITDNVTLAAGSNVTITPAGNTMTISAAVTQPALNPQQIALKRWYSANLSDASVPVGGSPQLMAFDGSSIWVSNAGDNTVSKIRTADGDLLGTFSVGPNPRSVEFDGTNIWVANFGSNTVTRLRASDGQSLDPILVANNPWGLAFDGKNMWVSCYGSGVVYKLDARSGQVLGTVAASNPLGLAFDGTNIWAVNNLGGGQVTKIAGTGMPTVLGVSNTNDGFPFHITFDGTHIWVNNSGGSLSKFRISDGANLGLFGLNARAGGGMTFDGTNLWISGEFSLVKFRTSDNTLQVFPLPYLAGGAVFDGANIWVANSNGTVTKH